MFCRYCGKEVKEKAIVCSGCGRPVDGEGNVSSGEGWSFGMMVGLLATTVFIPPVGLVFGFIGLAKDDKKAQAAVLLTVGVFMSLLWLAMVLGL